MALTDKLKAIGDAIREKTGKTGLIPLDQMPQEIERIQLYYDLFWDNYQDKGNREIYDCAFSCDRFSGNPYWTPQTLKPKYSFGDVKRAFHMFYIFNFNVGFMSYFKQFVPDFKFSLKESTDNTYAFCHAYFTNLPELDIRKAGKNNDLILGYAKKLQSVKLIVDNTVTPWCLMRNCDDLREIEIKGELCSQLFLETSTSLQKQSIINIINALSDNTSGKTLQLSVWAVKVAFADNGPIINNGDTTEEWLNLIATKPNWNISLL